MYIQLLIPLMHFFTKIKFYFLINHSIAYTVLRFISYLLKNTMNLKKNHVILNPTKSIKFRIEKKRRI